MGTDMSSWAFSDTGRPIVVGRVNDGPLPSQNYNFFSILDERRWGVECEDSSRIYNVIRIDTLDKPVWIHDPGSYLGMYGSKIVDAQSGRTEFDLYGPQTLMECGIERGGLVDEFFNGFNSSMRCFSIAEFLNYDWSQMVYDARNEVRVTARESVGEEVFTRIQAFVDAGATHIVYNYWRIGVTVMRIVSLKEFMIFPPGTVYEKTEDSSSGAMAGDTGAIMIKGDIVPISPDTHNCDWLENSLAGTVNLMSEDHPCGVDGFSYLRESPENSAPLITDCWGRTS